MQPQTKRDGSWRPSQVPTWGPRDDTVAAAASKTGEADTKSSEAAGPLLNSPTPTLPLRGRDGPFHLPPASPPSDLPHSCDAATAVPGEDSNGRESVPSADLHSPHHVDETALVSNIKETLSLSKGSYIKARENVLELEKRLTDAEQRADSLRQTYGEKLSALEEAFHRSETELKGCREALTAARQEHSSLSQRIVDLEQQVYSLSVENANLSQRQHAAINRAEAAATSKAVAEARQCQLEATVEHLERFTSRLQEHLFRFNADRDAALAAQQLRFEESRKRLVEFYDGREETLIAQLTDTVAKAYADAKVAAEEASTTATAEWKDIIDRIRAAYAEEEKWTRKKRAEVEQELSVRQRRMDEESERQQRALRSEMERTAEALRQREAVAAEALSARQRELEGRERALASQRSGMEEELRSTYRKREAELKAVHEQHIVSMREGFERERVRMVDSFADQLQRIANVHMDNEKELERLHREAQRESVQQMRRSEAAVQQNEAKSLFDESVVKTQDALLSRFESIESKQRVRAEQLRAAIGGGSTRDPTTPPA